MIASRPLLVAFLIVLATAPAHAGFDPGRITDEQVDEALDAAADSIRAGDVDRAARCYRAVLSVKPDHELALRQLWTIDRSRGIPDDPNQRNRLASRFPPGWNLRQTPHYLILYDASHAWADTRANMLEKTYNVFMDHMRRADLRPRPLASRLECVLFADHTDFWQYAQQVDGLSSDWPAGYYSSRTNRIALFNYATSPSMQELTDEMKQLRRRLDRLEGATPRDGRSWSDVTRTQRELNQVQRRYETIGAWGNIQQTIHEAVHQLAFNTGIQRRDIQYPLWFSEGLATCFETSHPAVPFGPTRDNPGRRLQVRKSYLRGELYPLHEFVGMTGAPEDKHAREVAYAQSWAVFHFLFNKRPDQLRNFIRHMLLQPAGQRDPATLTRDFTQAFGPPEKLNDAWIDHVQVLSRRAR